MGSEQSVQNQSGQQGSQSASSNRSIRPGSSSSRALRLRQAKSVGGQATSQNEDGDDSSGDRPGNTSPGPSICSDSDLPYISYTVNRPIGADSPKLSSKQTAQLQRGKSLGTALPHVTLYGGSSSSNVNRRPSSSFLSSGSRQQPQQRPHSIVVVKAASELVVSERDSDLVRLSTVPMFLPIMRGTLTSPAVRDPEVLERLDPGGTLRLCLRYQQHLSVCANSVASEQNALTAKMREVDFETTKIANVMAERQKKFAKCAEKLNKVTELSAQLNKCHSILNQTLESLDILNNALPIEERLEPFVWTTG